MQRSINYYTLLIFAPILIFTGIVGFFIPEQYALMSGQASYNIFHIVFGVIGLACLFSQSIKAIRLFNGIFGAIDVYQLLASFFLWFPHDYFLWKPTDNILHLLIGGWLVICAFWPTQK